MKHLVATPTATQTAAGPAPIQLVGLQMNAANRITGASPGPNSAQTMLSAKPVSQQRVNAITSPQLQQQPGSRNLNAATLKLTATTQAPNTTSTNIFGEFGDKNVVLILFNLRGKSISVNNTANLNPILMTAQHLQVKLQKQPQQRK